MAYRYYHYHFTRSDTNRVKTGSPLLRTIPRGTGLCTHTISSLFTLKRSWASIIQTLGVENFWEQWAQLYGFNLWLLVLIRKKRKSQGSGNYYYRNTYFQRWHFQAVASTLFYVEISNLLYLFFILHGLIIKVVAKIEYITVTKRNVHLGKSASDKTRICSADVWYVVMYPCKSLPDTRMWCSSCFNATNANNAEHDTLRFKGCRQGWFPGASFITPTWVFSLPLGLSMVNPLDYSCIKVTTKLENIMHFKIKSLLIFLILILSLRWGSCIYLIRYENRYLPR